MKRLYSTLFIFALMASACYARQPDYTNVLDFGADPNYNADSADAMNQAYGAAAVSSKKLLVPPGQYIVRKPVAWTGTVRVDVEAEGATFYGMATDMTLPVLTYGGFDNGNLRGLSVIARRPNMPNGIGVQIVNMRGADIRLGDVCNFLDSVQILADNAGLSYCRLTFRASQCKHALRSTIIGSKGWANGNTFEHAHFDGSEAMIFLDGDPNTHVRDGWIFNRCFFESASPNTRIFAGNELIDNVLFDAPWIENSNRMPLGLERDVCQNITFRRAGGSLNSLAIPKLPKKLRID